LQQDKHKPIDDQAILSAYRSGGDQKLLSELYKKYMHLVFGLCLKYLEDDEKAKDAVMDIYEILVVKLRKFEVIYFKSWLYMVAKNHCLEKLRKEKAHFLKESDANRMYSEQVFHPDSVVDPKLLEKMHGCLAILPKEQQECIDLFYLQEKSYKEICQLTKMTWNKVRSHIQNGRRSLKICMSK
jgi:RNA polymerase sigma-70 factor (ECF subfamily)